MQPHYLIELPFSSHLARHSRNAFDKLLLRSPLEQNDRNRMQLALSEITTNLIRHSKVKPLNVQLECFWDDSIFELRIRDDGSPIPEAMLETDLESILQGDIQASGYGLAMLFNQFDHIAYSSEPGVHQWTLSIPVAPKVKSQRSHILLLDDDIVQLEMLKIYLESHQVTAFSSALEAIRWLEDHQPDLIISDICMPEINGLEFRNRIHQLSHLSLTPFIFLTGDDDQQLAQKLVSEGIDDYLLKPITKEHLNRIVKRVLRRHGDLVSRTYAVVDHELKHYLRAPLNGKSNDHYAISSIAFSAKLGGGDYWLAHLDHQDLELILGDVMGHDLQACFMAGRQQGFFQALMASTGDKARLSSAEYLQCFSRWLDQYHPDLLTTVSFLKADKHKVALYSAGSPPALWLTAEGCVASVLCSGTLPGLGCSADFTPATLSLAPGERLLLYTDGLIEVSSDYAEQQERITRLIALLSQHRRYSLSELTAELHRLIREKPVADDLSVIMVEKC